MLKLSDNAITMLVSKYRAVLQRMFIKNTAVFAACCIILSAPAAAGAADITYNGDFTDLKTATIGGAGTPSLFPGTSTVPGASGNNITVDYASGTDPYRVFGGLSNSAAVTNNTVSLLNGNISNNLYGGYDAAATGGAGAANNSVTIAGGTISGNAISGMSLSGEAIGNSLTITGGTVTGNLFGGNSNGSGAVSGNSLTMTGGTVTGNLFGGSSNGSGTVSGNSVIMSGGTAEFIYAGNSSTVAGNVTGNSVSMSGGMVVHELFGGNSKFANAENNSVVISGTAQIGDDVYGGVSYENGTASGNSVIMSGGTAGQDLFGGVSDSNTTDGSGGAIANSVNLTGGTVVRNVYGGYDWGTMGSGSALNNQVTLAGAAVTGSVLGGATSNGLTSGNTVHMTSGSAGGQLVGGQSLGTGNEANANRVTLSGGTVGTHIIGGLSESDSASGNVVELSGGHVGQNVTGGSSITSGTVKNNRVVISGSTQIDGHVRGAWTDTGNAIGNGVTMTGGTVNKNVFGGISASADATDNTVVISGGSFGSGNFIVGAAAGNSGNSLRNSVTVTGGILNTVTGGEAWGTGNVEGNRVVIAGTAEVGFVHGGYAGSTGDATGNSVLLDGGLVTGDVFGGFSDTGSANGNTVTLGRNAHLANTSSVYGGWINPASSGTATGNTLNINAFQGTLNDVNKFQNYNFFLPASLRNGGTVLTVTNNQTDLAGTHVAITGMEGGTFLAPGSTVTLISSTQGTPASYSASNVRSGISLIYDFGLDAAGTTLLATINSVQVNPQTKALAEGRAAGMAFVNQGAELVAQAGMTDAVAKAQEGKGDKTSFGAVAYGASRYNTGSYADVDGTSLMTGLAIQRETKNGSLVRGLFLEAGWGNYDTCNSFATMPSVRGDGDTSYYGIGALIRNDAPDGRYLEGSVRGGKSRTTFGSGDLNNASYTTNSGYYGAHIGIGKLKTVGDKTLDYYAKYFWTHQNGSDVSIAGDLFSFTGVDSSRLRGGVRLSRELDSKRASYVGLAYEYEFDGKTKGSVYGLSLDAPSLRGGTGILELGMSCKSRPESSNTLELGLQGYAGKREGVTGTIQLKRVF